MDSYGAGSGQPGYGTAAEIPLVPRQQRRRQRLARAALMLVLVLVGLGAAGYVVQNRFLGDDDGSDGVPAAAASPSAIAAAPSAATPPTSPPTATSRAAVAAVVATATATTAAPPATTATAAAPAREESTRPARGADAAANAEESVDEEEPTGPRPPIEELLPTAEEAPADLPLAVDVTERTEDEVVTSLGGTEEAAQSLQEWGWEGNSYVQFAAPDPDELPPGSTSAVDVSIHRFADPASAAAALPYFSDQVVAALGLEEMRVDPIGDEVRVLRGLSEAGVALVVAYVQDGRDLIRVGGTSNTAEGDPTPDVLAAAEAVVARAR